MAFKNENGSASGGSDENGALLLAAAGAVSPVSELNAQNRAALCKTASVVHVQRNDQIKPEGAHRWLMYLVEGSLSLYQGKEEVGSLAARTPEAMQPLFQDKSAYQSVRTPTVAKIVRFGREQLDILLREQQKNAIHVVDVHVDEADNAVFDDVAAAIGSNAVKLASFGETATRILTSYQSIKGIPELADVIQSDPGLTAHIVNASNKVDAGASDSTTSIRGAITRLGVENTQALMTELLKANTIVPANEALQKRFRRYSQRTTLSSAIVQVLARSMPDLKPEVASLVALTADIGELLVLTYANAHAERFSDEAQLAATIEKLRTILSGWLLALWDFPADFVDASQKARDWYRNHSGEITYTDLVTASLLIIQSEMPDAEHSSIPGADNLLLARRLQQAGIDLKSPDEIVKAATSKLMNVQQLLKAS